MTPGEPGQAAAASAGSIVVGIAPDEAARVLLEAARFARELGTELVCAHVDAARYPIEVREDGTVSSMPLDPEVPDVRDETVDPSLARHVLDTLAGADAGVGADAGLRVRFFALAGDPAQALGRLAESLDARAIVVGTRHPGVRAGLEEFFTGSIAVRLAHRQSRPVIVIPLQPHPTAAPWELEE
ncbi:universal stress protein [Rathayibacter soli]|uniref:universal stress protein n=1 Tax=Rathayibacter soli TaxID=3144168 RepID=UPI0027E3EDB3|nr:universal stress protein [Glaciibacter superstes]